MIGDFFLRVGGTGNNYPAELWICTSYSAPNQPVWQQVQLK